uniref:Serpentine receptor class gamma n=1 Tax=Panagrellus redivivus TaxID=6233 RepID=A0A7E4V102_PANRE
MEQEQEEEDTLSDAEPDVNEKDMLIYAHAAWLFATFTGLVGFCYVYTKNMNGITYLPVYVYFSVIYVAKSYLSYTKTMILTMLSFFPIVVTSVNIVPQFNGLTMNFLLNALILCYLGSHMIGFSCWKLRKDELNGRFLTDENSEKLYYNMTLFTENCFYCLSAANTTATLLGCCYLYGYILPDRLVTQSELPPASFFCKSVFTLAICVFGLMTLDFAKNMFCSFLKIRSLKASEKDVENAEGHFCI